MNQSPQRSIKVIARAPVEAHDLRLCWGFAINDNDILMQGACEGFLFFAIADSEQVSGLFWVEFPNYLGDN